MATTSSLLTLVQTDSSYVNFISFIAPLVTSFFQTLRSAYATGGIGSHVVAAGTGATTGPDGLNSQGAISVSASSNMLVTVNVRPTRCSIKPVWRALLRLAPTPSLCSRSMRTTHPTWRSLESQYPAVVISLLRLHSIMPVILFVCWTEELSTVSGLFPFSYLCLSATSEFFYFVHSCFHVNQTSGLQIIPETTRYLHLNQTTPATTGAGSTVGQVLFSADDTQLLASVKGLLPGPPAVVGYIAIWDIDESDGSLSEKYMPIAPPKNGNNPFGFTRIAGENSAIIAADTNDGFTIFDLSDGSKSSSVDVNTLGAICWSTYSPKTGNYYMIDAGGAVFEVNIDSNLKGSVVQVASFFFSTFLVRPITETYPQQYNSTNMVGLFDGDVASLQDNEYVLLYHLISFLTFSSILASFTSSPKTSVQSRSCLWMLQERPNKSSRST